MIDGEFIHVDAQSILDSYITEYLNAYEKQTGQTIILSPSDPVRIFLQALAVKEIILLNRINFVARQVFLKYAEGKYLDDKSYGRTTNRKEAEYAYCIERFTFSEPLQVAQIIPAGTRVTGGNGVYFHILTSVHCPTETTETDITFVCMEAGQIGNGYLPGMLNILVDPLPFVESVSNITESTGGAEQESDDAFRERIQMSPEGYSTAGPEAAYIYHAMQFDPLIEYIKPSSPSPGVVDLCVIKAGGEIPDDEYKEKLREHISARDKRPMTDFVQVSTPNIVHYSIDLTYYISADVINPEQIHAAVLSAVQDYALWQKRKIGRNIDPSELVRLVKNAGASRISIASPVFAVVDESSIAVVDEYIAQFGGVEDE